MKKIAILLVFTLGTFIVKIEYNDGSEKTIGYKVLGLIFITDEI